ncbi:MAG: hypothetical protein ACIAQZ_01035 [Sedimentisphaeraceae bacterium JB056]
MTNLSWKENWKDTAERFKKWWKQEGFLLGEWTPSIVRSDRHEQYFNSIETCTLKQQMIDSSWRSKNYHNFLAQRDFAADVLPIADTDLGPGSLCLYLGCEPLFTEETIWYEHLKDDMIQNGQIIFDQTNKWWQLQCEIIQSFIEKCQGKYAVGIPDLVEGVDTLASMRGTENLLMDMIEKPAWVLEKLEELHIAYFEVYNRIYDLVKLEDGSSFFNAFRLWAPGKVAKIQCDTSTMLSPDMFGQFVIPYITRQCETIHKTLYHLDGTQSIMHLDQLLEIEQLDAIEWTPQAGIESGGDPRWYDLYKRILDAGKSVQAVAVRSEEVIPLIDAVGAKGMYILTAFENRKQAENLHNQVLKRI